MTMEEALHIIKKNKNPLACYVFTSSKKKEKAWMENLTFGGGCINNAAWHFANHSFPFGGVGKESSAGLNFLSDNFPINFIY